MMWVLTLNIEPWINVNYLPRQPGFQKGEEAVDAAECKHSRGQKMLKLRNKHTLILSFKPRRN